MLKKLLPNHSGDLGRWGRFVWFQVKLWPHCMRMLKLNRSGQQAAALSYHTIFGLVPLAIIILMIFQFFPGYSESGQRARDALYDYFNLSDIKYPIEENSEETISLSHKIDEITNRFTTKINKGAITFVSLIFVVWAAIALLTTIERAFNGIWHVSRGRNFFQRIVNYWTLLTLGPLLLILAFYFTTSEMLGKNTTRYVMDVISFFGPYVVSVVFFFFLYLLMPNTKVNPKAALWGAAVAALVWTGAKYLFGIYVIEFIPSQKVYGVMGIIPISVLWIFITWMIVLFGVNLTYTTQYLKKLDANEIEKLKKDEEFFVITDLTVIEIMVYALEVFNRNEGVLTGEMVSKKMDMPIDLCRMVLDHLVGEGMLLNISEPVNGVVLSGDARNISLGDIERAAAVIGAEKKKDEMPEKLRSLVDKKADELSGLTLNDFAENPCESGEGEEGQSQTG